MFERYSTQNQLQDMKQVWKTRFRSKIYKEDESLFLVASCWSHVYYFHIYGASLASVLLSHFKVH